MRFTGQKKKSKSLEPYKSTLEKQVASTLVDFLYEPKENILSYTVEHKYTPDFVHPDRKDILIEVKGYFIKGAEDQRKYLSVIRSNPQIELVFIFSNPLKRCHSGCRNRKDGTFMSLKEWCIKNNILFFTHKTVPKEILEGKWDINQVRKYKEKLYSAEEIYK